MTLQLFELFYPGETTKRPHHDSHRRVIFLQDLFQRGFSFILDKAINIESLTSERIKEDMTQWWHKSGTSASIIMQSEHSSWSKAFTGLCKLSKTCMCMRVCVWFVTAVSVSYIFLRCSVSHYVSLLFTFIYSLPAILAKTASGSQISVAMCAIFQPFFCEPNAVPVVAGNASVASRPGVGLTNSFMLLLPTNSMGWGVSHFMKHVGRLMPPSFEVLGSVASCNRSDSAGVIATDGHWFAERTMCGIASEKVPVDVWMHPRPISWQSK